MSGSQVEATRVNTFDVTTLIRYIFGSRDAILTITDTPSSLWLGLLFVMSAGFAREYDAEDLLREPWHLFLPLVASVATSLLLYSLLHWKLSRDNPDSLEYWSGYRTFLSLYWLTAPLAWIYAIPVERILPPVEATQVNFAMLGVVSTWRVLLITRVICVWLNARWWSALFLVLFFADTVLAVLAWTVPTPIFSIMGGAHLSLTDSLIAGIGFATRFFSSLAWPVLLLISAVIVSVDRDWQMTTDQESRLSRIGNSAWALGIAALLIWVLVLPITQPEQRRASYVAELLRNEDSGQAFTYMSKFDRKDFPPIWDPPPEVGYGVTHPSSESIFDALDGSHKKWVRIMYLEKLSLRGDLISFIPYNHSDEISASEIDRIKKLAELLRNSGPPSNLNHSLNWDLQGILVHPKIEEDLKAPIQNYLEIELDAPIGTLPRSGSQADLERATAGQHDE